VEAEQLRGHRVTVGLVADQNAAEGVAGEWVESFGRLRRSPASSVGSVGIRLPLPEEGTPRPTGEQADEDDDGRDEIVDRPAEQHYQLTVRAEDNPPQTLLDENDRGQDAQDPCPPSAEEQPYAGPQFQGDRNHHSRPIGVVGVFQRDPHRENESSPPEQEDRHEVHVLRDTLISIWRLSGLRLNGTHAGESTNVYGHPYGLQIRSPFWNVGGRERPWSDHSPVSGPNPEL
jgi:hypothetical protein